MSLNSAATVTTVKLKVLEIEEQAGGEEQPPVDVTLKKGGSVGNIDGTEIYQGKMKYCDDGKKRTVDMVQAVFPAKREKAMPGNVKLQITLKSCNEFLESPVTTVPNDPKTIPTHCLSIESTSKSMITVTFIEPQPGEFVAYPALYFHTTQGVIDPGVSIKRRPG